MTEIEEAWDELASRLWNLQLDDQHGLVADDGWLPSPEKDHDDHSPRTEELLWIRLTDLASLLNHKTLHEDRAYTPNMWACLADVSRDLPILRVLFGLRRRPSDTENEEQLDEAGDPDCVLEAARRLLDPAKPNLTPSLRRQALRIVANCCADNDVNRALIIGRHGIEHLKVLANGKQELDVLLPTLYNICVDYDVMAVDSSGAQLKMAGTLDEPEKTQDGMTLTVAEQVLCTYNDELEKTSIEVFLTLWSDIDSSQIPVLADIIEMASRSILFGTEHMLDTNEPSLVQSRLKNLFNTLSLEAQNFDEEARETLLQTYFNLLTQSVIQEYLARSSDDLESFAIRLYDDQYDFTEHETFPAAFLKLSYAISSFPAYADANEPNSDFIGYLVHLVCTSRSPMAPVLVLLTNSLTSINRINHFQGLYQLLNSDLFGMVGYPSDNTVPALNLCTRLALTRPGQADLFSARYFHVLSDLLGRNMKAKKSLEIDREAIVLARLMVKSQNEHATAILAEDSKLFSTIVDLAFTTIDASSKLEAGRFVVEVLRTLLARSNLDTVEATPTTTAATASPASAPEESLSSTDAPSNSSEPLAPLQAELFLASASNAAVATILFLITDAPSSAARAEGLFGLALFSTLPAVNIQNSIIDILRQQKEKVFPIFNDIVTATGQPDRKAEVENLKFLLLQLLTPQPTTQGQASGGSRSSDLQQDSVEQEGFTQDLCGIADSLGLSIST